MAVKDPYHSQEAYLHPAISRKVSETDIQGKQPLRTNSVHWLTVLHIDLYVPHVFDGLVQQVLLHCFLVACSCWMCCFMLMLPIMYFR